MPVNHTTTFPWLSQYASNHHRWRTVQHNDQTIFYRPLGFVENAFDSDGTYYEGRADVNLELRFDARTGSTPEQLRRRILLAWTVLRLQHTMLSATAVGRQDYMVEEILNSRDRFFVIERPENVDGAISKAKDTITFLDDHYEAADTEQLYLHSQNTARLFDAEKALARLLVLPTTYHENGQATVRLLLVMGHQITDGLTNSTWTSHLLDLLNSKQNDLERSLSQSLSSIHDRLVVPQEDLYPPVTGSIARKRWFWTLTIVLRHVRKPQPPAFPNPLVRERPREKAVRLHRRLPRCWTMRRRRL